MYTLRNISEVLRNENYPAAIFAHTQVPQSVFVLLNLGAASSWKNVLGKFTTVLYSGPRGCETVALPIAERSYFQTGVKMDYFSCTCQ